MQRGLERVCDHAGAVLVWVRVADAMPLLRPVVEVALKPPPLRVAGRDEALAPGAQLGQAGPRTRRAAAHRRARSRPLELVAPGRSKMSHRWETWCQPRT